MPKRTELRNDRRGSETACLPVCPQSSHLLRNSVLPKLCANLPASAEGDNAAAPGQHSLLRKEDKVAFDNELVF